MILTVLGSMLNSRVNSLLGSLVVIGFFNGIAAYDLGAEEIERGRYIFNAAGCFGCHTDVLKGGEALAGGRSIVTMYGTFFSPNITPDRSFGIGTWSELDFRRALRAGRAPNGKPYYPSFPYSSFTRMSDEDIEVLWAFISKLPKSERPNTQHKLWFPFNLRVLMWGWQAMFFKRDPIEYNSAKTGQWNRGAYLVEALVHCGECHTSRNIFGVVNREFALGGNSRGPGGKAVPNITSDRTDGIGLWSKEEIVEYLVTGMTPEGDFAAGAMAEVINQTTRKLSEADRMAIATYVKDLPVPRGRLKKY